MKRAMPFFVISALPRCSKTSPADLRLQRLQTSLFATWLPNSFQSMGALTPWPAIYGLGAVSSWWYARTIPRLPRLTVLQIMMDILPHASKNRDVSITHAISKGTPPFDSSSVHGWIRTIFDECWQWKPESRPTIDRCKGIIMHQSSVRLTVNKTDEAATLACSDLDRSSISPPEMSRTNDSPTVGDDPPLPSHEEANLPGYGLFFAHKQAGADSTYSLGATIRGKAKSTTVTVHDEDDDLDDLDGKLILPYNVKIISDCVSFKMSSRSSETVPNLRPRTPNHHRHLRQT